MKQDKEKLICLLMNESQNLQNWVEMNILFILYKINISEFMRRKFIILNHKILWEVVLLCVTILTVLFSNLPINVVCVCIACFLPLIKVARINWGFQVYKEGYVFDMFTERDSLDVLSALIFPRIPIWLRIQHSMMFFWLLS